eukprot:CFRG4523T1
MGWFNSIINGIENVAVKKGILGDVDAEVTAKLVKKGYVVRNSGTVNASTPELDESWNADGVDGHEDGIASAPVDNGLSDPYEHELANKTQDMVLDNGNSHVSLVEGPSDDELKDAYASQSLEKDMLTELGGHELYEQHRVGDSVKNASPIDMDHGDDQEMFVLQTKDNKIESWMKEFEDLPASPTTKSVDEGDDSEEMHERERADEGNHAEVYRSQEVCANEEDGDESKDGETSDESVDYVDEDGNSIPREQLDKGMWQPRDMPSTGHDGKLYSNGDNGEYEDERESECKDKSLYDKKYYTESEEEQSSEGESEIEYVDEHGNAIPPEEIESGMYSLVDGEMYPNAGENCEKALSPEKASKKENMHSRNDSINDNPNNGTYLLSESASADREEKKATRETTDTKIVHGVESISSDGGASLERVGPSETDGLGTAVVVTQAWDNSALDNTEKHPHIDDKVEFNHMKRNLEEDEQRLKHEDEQCISPGKVKKDVNLSLCDTSDPDSPSLDSEYHNTQQNNQSSNSNRSPSQFNGDATYGMDNSGTSAIVDPAIRDNEWSLGTVETPPSRKLWRVREEYNGVLEGDVDVKDMDSGMTDLMSFTTTEYEEKEWKEMNHKEPDGHECASEELQKDVVRAENDAFEEREDTKGQTEQLGQYKVNNIQISDDLQQLRPLQEETSIPCPRDHGSFTAVQDESTNLTQLEESMLAVTEENKTLRQSLQETVLFQTNAATKVKQLEEFVIKLESENNGQKGILEVLQSELNGCKGELAVAHEERRNVEDRRLELQEMCSTLTDEKANLSSVVDTLSNKVEGMSGELEAAKGVAWEATKELQLVQEKNESSRADERSCDILVVSLAAAEAASRERDDIIRNMKQNEATLEGNIEHSKSEIARLEREKDILKGEMANVISEKGDWKKQNESIAHGQNALLGENNELKHQLDAMVNELETLKRTHESLVSNYETVKSENSNLQEQNEVLQIEREKTNGDLDVNWHANREMNGQDGQRTTEDKSIALRERIIELETELSELHLYVESERKELDLCVEIDELKEENKRLQHEILSLENESAESKTETAHVQDKSNKIAQEKVTLEQELSASNLLCEKLKKELNELDDASDEMSRKLQEISSGNGDVEFQHRLTEERLSVLTAQVASMEAEADEADDEICELVKKLELAEQSRDMCTSLQEEIEILKKERDSLAVQMKKLSSDIAVAVKERDQYKTELGLLRKANNTLEDVQRTLRNTKDELEKAEKTKDTLAKDFEMSNDRDAVKKMAILEKNEQKRATEIQRIRKRLADRTEELKTIKDEKFDLERTSIREIKSKERQIEQLKTKLQTMEIRVNRTMPGSSQIENLEALNRVNIKQSKDLVSLRKDNEGMKAKLQALELEKIRVEAELNDSRRRIQRGRSTTPVNYRRANSANFRS